jgi:hypothetical protein
LVCLPMSEEFGVSMTEAESSIVTWPPCHARSRTFHARRMHSPDMKISSRVGCARGESEMELSSRHLIQGSCRQRSCRTQEAIGEHPPLHLAGSCPGQLIHHPDATRNLVGTSTDKRRNRSSPHLSAERHASFRTK